MNTNVQAIYEATTETIVKALEDGTEKWVMPWSKVGTSFPQNAITGKQYQGGNVLSLWASAIENDYGSGNWATYKQWSSIDCTVRKGERASNALFFSPIRQKVDDTIDNADTNKKTFSIARSFALFNAEQVDGYVGTEIEINTFERINIAEKVFGAIGAKVEHRSEGRAYYDPDGDRVVLPPFESFTDAHSYYGTSAHEHAHWTGHEDRLNRTFGKRFGDEAYGMEELVAELSSAFTCARLGLSPVPRPDHAAYIASWIRTLKADVTALHHVASKAQEATNFLLNLAGFDELT